MPVSLRLAMWSGPRNISTALMRAWENREDCVVWDEPLYGYYLHATGIPHPGVDEVIAANPSQAEAYKGGKTQLLGFFVGQVMKASQGKANPAMVKEILKQKLD